MNNQDSECPCTNCITFSICKAEISEKGDLSIFYTLKPKCSLIEDYLNYRAKGTPTFEERYVKLLDLFKIKKTTNWGRLKNE